jgi:hypothetical protein
VQHQAVAALLIVDDEPRPMHLGMPPDDRRDLRRVHEHALDLRRLVGASQPALDALVGAPARRASGEGRREVSRAEANQRVIGIDEARHDDFA